MQISPWNTFYFYLHDTITFYEGEDFSGNAEMCDDGKQSSELNNPG